MEPQPLSRTKGIAMLVYGIPGAGKTRLISTAPRTLIVRPPIDHTDSILLRDNVAEMVVTGWSDMLEAFQYVQQGGYKNFDWVWLDSISLFQDTGLDDVFADAVARKPSRAEYGPDKGEYGINMDRLAKWVRDFVGLAKDGAVNFGVTAHPFSWYDPVKQEDVWAPWVQGKNMSPKICGYMNVVAHLAVAQRNGKPPQRVLLTDAEGFVGKDQFDAIPALKSGRHGLVEPTMEDVTRVINASRPKRPARRKRGGSK